MEILDIADFDWVERSTRTIGGIIDRAIYSVVEAIMQLIMDLSNTEIFSQSVIDEFATRIYIILGLVMVFKLMVSFIQILVNPDKMDDKEQGVTGVLKRAVISLVLIFMVPSIFDLARQVQGYVLPVIPRVILGANVDASNQNEVDETMSRVGQMIAFYSFLPFFTYSDPNCDGGEILGPMNDTSDYSIWSVSTAVDNLKTPCDNSPNGYKFEYGWPLSSLVGIYLLFVLIQVAIAIAIRAIKLGICEFIAPIPIASYIDPKTSKQAFDTWVKTTIQVYLDLFIRLIVVYFVVFVFMTVLDATNLSTIYARLGGNIRRGALVTLFIILGLLQFVKQAPKFICDMLGFKGSGDIAGMFKGAWTSAQETGGYVRNLGRIARSNWRELGGTVYDDGSKPGFLRRTGSVVAGLGGVTARTIGNKMSGKSGKELSSGAFNSATEKRNSRISTKNRRIGGYSWEDERAEKVRQRLNVSSFDDWSVAKHSEFSSMADLFGELTNLGLKKGEEQAGDIPVNFDGKNITYTELQSIANSTAGDTWNGKPIDVTMRGRAKDAVLKVQKNNKTMFSADLLNRNDTGAEQIYNKIVDRFRNSSAYSSNEAVEVFKNSLFGDDDNLTINGKSYNKTDFNYDQLMKIFENHDNFANQKVINGLKDASEKLRNIEQIESAAAARRTKARQDASK